MKPIEGEVTGIINGVLQGWAYNPEKPEEKPSVRVFVDGNLVSEAKADFFMPELGIGEGKHGFAVNLDPSVTMDRVSAKVKLGKRSYFLPVRGEIFKASVLHPSAKAANEDTPPKADFYEGFLDGVKDGRLYGWAWNKSAPDERVILKICLAGEFTRAGKADIYQSGLNEAGIGDGAHGFSVPLPVLPYPGVDVAIHVYAGKDDTELFGSPLTVRMPEISAALTPDSADALKTLERVKYLSEGNAESKLTALRAMADPDFAASFPPLSFPVHKSPEVSVIIPAYNHFALTYRCLCSLLLARTQARFEVILSDDASSDETARAEEIISGIKISRAKKNGGFISSCNRGASEAKGKYLVFLNNDTEVTHDWLDKLLETFKRDESVGIAGSKLIYPDGKLQEAGAILWRDASAWNYGRGENALHPRYNYAREVDYVSGASLMITAQLFKEIGGFDKRYAPAYCEDSDLCMEAAKRGRKVIYQPLSTVIHYEGASSGTDISTGVKSYQKTNSVKFLEKWRKELAALDRNGVAPERNKDRGVSMRALFVDALVPRPDMDAGSFATVQEMRVMQSLGFKISFASEHMIHGGKYTEALQETGIECAYSPFYRGLRDFLSERGRELDVIYVYRYYVARRFISLFRELAPQAKIIFNNCDLHYLRESRQARISSSREAFEAAMRTREEELDVSRLADATLVYNETEREIIMAEAFEAKNVHKISWAAETAASPAPFESRKDIYFLGGYDHHPNRDAVEFFATQVMPILRKTLPGARFIACGSNVPDSLRDLERPDVIIKGYVSSIEEVFGKCRVFVSPLRYGAGLKGKIVHCMTYGAPCVATPVSLEGLAITPGREVLAASLPSEIAAAVARLYNDKKLWGQMSKAALEHAKANYSFASSQNRFREILLSLSIPVGG